VSAEVRRILCEYFGMSAKELGLKCVEQKRAEQKRAEQKVSNDQTREQALPALPATIPSSSLTHSLPSPTRDIIEENTVIHSEGQDQDMDKQRRQLLKASGIVIVPQELVDPALLERFSRVLSPPCHVDERFLRYLEAQTIHYWQCHYLDALPPRELLGYVTEHLRKIMSVLEKSLLPTERQQLCASAGKTALLIGTLLFDLGRYVQAQSFCQAAIQAAREASFLELEAASWGWMSLSFTYTHDFQAARDNIQTARHKVESTTNLVVRGWLAAVEAEIQAHLHNQEACLKALDDAEGIKAIKEENQWTTMTNFHQCKLAGYQGTCARLLYAPGHGSTAPLLTEAQNALFSAITMMNHSQVGERSVLHTDLAGIYLRQDVIEEAYKHANAAIALAGQAKSPHRAQRLLMLRTELEMWKDTDYVKNLDEALCTIGIVSLAKE
jgi:tetratricopeptide (TPR) repeat protein